MIFFFLNRLGRLFQKLETDAKNPLLEKHIGKDGDKKENTARA